MENMLRSTRLKRELKTIEAMVRIYCNAHHNPVLPDCLECTKLLDYARERLSRCPFQSKKPTCGNCLVHCYKRDMREVVRKIMRYSGPRMIYRHPILAVYHIFDGRRKPLSLHDLRSNKKNFTQEAANNNTQTGTKT